MRSQRNSYDDPRGSSLGNSKPKNKGTNQGSISVSGKKKVPRMWNFFSPLLHSSITVQKYRLTRSLCKENNCFPSSLKGPVLGEKTPARLDIRFYITFPIKFSACISGFPLLASSSIHAVRYTCTQMLKSFLGQNSL